MKRIVVLIDIRRDTKTLHSNNLCSLRLETFPSINHNRAVHYYNIPHNYDNAYIQSCDSIRLSSASKLTRFNWIQFVVSNAKELLFIWILVNMQNWLTFELMMIAGVDGSGCYTFSHHKHDKHSPSHIFLVQKIRNLLAVSFKMEWSISSLKSD